MAARLSFRLLWLAHAAVFSALLGSASALHAASDKGDMKSRAAQEMVPAMRIPVEPLGFAAPSRFYLTARLSSVTLDFIDADHLLFTFRKGGLLQRVPDDPDDDMDQVIHALVLETATGKVVKETTWRMHDREAYLWALGNGRFLVRQRNVLYQTDSSLGLRPYLQPETQIEAVSVSPTHRLLAIETVKYLPLEAAQKVPEGDAAKPSQAPTLGPDAPHPGEEEWTRQQRKRTQILLVKLPENKMIARSETRTPVSIPMLPEGIVNTAEGKAPDDWLVHAAPFRGDEVKMGELRSACEPTVETLSETAAMVMGCPGGTSDHSITVFSTQGGVLWQQRWLSRYIWPTFAFAENGTRFAYGSLEINHTIGSLDPFGEDDVLDQPVGVFDTQTGKLELVKTASPEVSAGHNYALSADGLEFAILREGAIEIYRLPPAPSR
ncbi:hypothetical protein [Silvibacterium dinghuense]|uniref:Uncharacterized protein n=1 Tax=Silvibacterium dinghuense TaxID=1560006 RepID=A0A4Q1SJ11_9BACT|nr:hypothetical protein [Silvibacterium dinghuense]RXS97240.1 hypothetical protein ESZ00_04825 [Silvibacterium dinghuense]GGG97370.1 hypothetical protein GCM10011586_10810 [Silvibacterium dinghuense]